HDGPPVRVSPEIADVILQEAVACIRDASQGERNDTLNRKAFEIGQLVAGGTIPREYAEQILTQAGLTCGLPAYSVRATVTSGLDGGAKKPLTAPFAAAPPVAVGLPAAPVVTRWTPARFSAEDLMNTSALKKPQLFEDWSTEDICLTSADGGTGKTTLALYESVCLALGTYFLGFRCLQAGKTLYITGEDTQQKIGGIIGAICRQMGLNNSQIATVLDSIYVKKDSDLCLVTKDRGTGFLHMNAEAMRRVLEAVEDVKPKRIVFDPISMFWGPESALNDMNKVVAKFMSELVDRSGAQVEMINHMGKSSSSQKDFTQFAGRGGSGLPSHARVVRGMHVVHGEEYTDLTGENLTERQSAIRIVVSKFSDGSPIYNKPFVLVRDGYLFSRKALAPQKERELEDSQTDTERIMSFIKEARRSNKFPTKPVIEGHFLSLSNKITQTRTARALDKLMFDGWNGEKIKLVENPDAMVRARVYVVTDEQGNEII
ncbi:MAG: AAA family ATPase, partial [Afipia sp.]